MPDFQIKRIYDRAEASDGFRVLADRLWPRGVKKDAARIDLWAKELTPTDGLRQDYHSGRVTWPDFESGYRAELATNPAVDDFLVTVQDQKTVTLLFAAKDTEHTHAKVLMDVLGQR